MDRALYVAMSGAKQNTLAQTAHANNLANASTIGFKSDIEQSRAMSVFGEHFPTRAFALSERPATDFQAGPMDATGNPLDIYIKGEGFLAVQDVEGNEAYTRAGNLQTDITGRLINGQGHAVKGNGGNNIVIPQYENIYLGPDGTISIQPVGAPANALEIIDRVKLVKPDNADMYKGTDGLFRERGAQPKDTIAVDASVEIQSGFVEGSNVNPVSALTNMMALSRQYEMSVKLMSTVEENARASERILQMQ